MSELSRTECESRLRMLIDHAWDREVSWPEIQAWANNFNGQVIDKEEEQIYALFTLSRFMYFGKKLMREMLRSLYREHFESPLKQRIRRNLRGKATLSIISNLYAKELSSTRFIGVGNPSESGAHLLYYFRQINRLPKDLFVDLSGAIKPSADRKTGEVKYVTQCDSVSRIVFFDDLAGSGDQACSYLSRYLPKIRAGSQSIDLRYMSLFASTTGMEKLNRKGMFSGKAMCLFELDESYKAFHELSRYFISPPPWFDSEEFSRIAKHYGKQLQPDMPLGYKDGQQMLAFSHNTPDNTLPIFWDEGVRIPWSPAFVRFDKNYGVSI